METEILVGMIAAAVGLVAGLLMMIARVNITVHELEDLVEELMDDPYPEDVNMFHEKDIREAINSAMDGYGDDDRKGMIEEVMDRLADLRERYNAAHGKD